MCRRLPSSAIDHNSFGHNNESPFQVINDFYISILKSRAISALKCSHTTGRQDQSCANFLLYPLFVRRRSGYALLLALPCLYIPPVFARDAQRLALLVLSMIIFSKFTEVRPTLAHPLTKRIAPQRRHRGTIASPTESTRQTSFEDFGYSGKCPKTHCGSRIAHPCPMTASLGCPNPLHRASRHQENIKERYLNCRLQLNCRPTLLMALGRGRLSRR